MNEMPNVLSRRRALVAAAGGLALLDRGPSASAASAAETDRGVAPTQFVDVRGTPFAYRRFGREGRPPIVLLQHFRGTMDWWDPLVTDGLARDRPVVLFDNRGVGRSGGGTPASVEAMAADAAAFIEALGLTKVDLLGFSIGGFAAQELTLSRPDLIRRVILAGTGPQGGAGMQANRPDVAKAATGDDPGAARAFLFFSPSEESQAAAKQFMARTAAHGTDDRLSSKQTMMAQGQAIQAWGAAPLQDYLGRLRTFAAPTLVVSGDDDIMVPTINAFTLSQAIPRAELIVYPDAGHGSLFQYAPLFVEHARLFLDRNDPGLS